MTRVIKQFVVGLVVLLLVNEYTVMAQTYVPVPLTTSSFNADGIAESGNDAWAVTSTGLDEGFKILYTKNFAASNTMLTSTTASLPYVGGIPDNGVISQATAGTFILAPYTSNNMLYMSKSAAMPNTSSSGRFTLSTPAAYTSLHLLGYSTQGTSTFSATLNFTDGTTQSIASITYSDWFFATTSVVTQGFGRIARPGSSTPGGPGNTAGASSGYVVEGITSSDSSLNDPRMYYATITIPCANQTKLLQSIDFVYLSPGGGSFTDRAVILALNGIPYAVPTFTYTTTPASCNGGTDGSATVSVTSPGSSTGTMYYIWSPSSSAPTGSATMTGLAAGTYTVSPTDKAGLGCPYPNITVVVPTASAVSVTASASPATICSGNSSQLTATVTGGTLNNVTWTPGNAQGTTTTVTPATTTTYTVSGTDNNGCNVQATTKVTVNPTPVATYTITPATLCPGDTATATFTGTASSSAVYTWDFGSTTKIVPGSSGAGPYQLIFLAGTTSTSLKVVDGSCSATSTPVTATMPTPRTASFSISHDTICSSQTITVAFTGVGNSSDTYNWDFGGGTATPATTTGQGPYTVQYNTAKDTTVLSLSISFAGCVTPTYRDSLWVDQSPTANFRAVPLTGCALQNVTFTNSSTGAAGYIWSLGNADTTTTPSAKTFVHTYDTGSYTITLRALSADGKCESDLTKTNYIKILPKPIAAFTSTPDINTSTQLSQAQFTFTNGSQNATSYQWSFGDGGTSTDTDPVYKYTTAGNYIVTLYAFNSIGCVDSTSKSFYEIVPDSTLRIPNAFSPNGDGINDKWVIPGLVGALDVKLDIYNRWGQRVYTSHGAYEPWDGTYQGKPMPLGTFYYVLVVPATKHSYSGWVLLTK